MLCLYGSEDNLQEELVLSFPSCGSEESSLVYQAWWQVPLPDEPSHWLLNSFFFLWCWASSMLGKCELHSQTSWVFKILVNIKLGRKRPLAYVAVPLSLWSPEGKLEDRWLTRWSCPSYLQEVCASLFESPSLDACRSSKKNLLWVKICETPYIRLPLTSHPSWFLLLVA